MAKSKKKSLISLILVLVASVFAILATVSVFFTAFKADALGGKTGFSEARFVVSGIKGEDKIGQDFADAIASGDQNKIETATKGALAYGIGSFNSATEGNSAVILITFFATLLFGSLASVFSLISISGKAKITATILTIITAVLGLVSMICSALIVGEIGSNVYIGCATILTFVFGLIASGLHITNNILSKKKKRA